MTVSQKVAEPTAWWTRTISGKHPYFVKLGMQVRDGGIDLDKDWASHSHRDIYSKLS